MQILSFFSPAAVPTSSKSKGSHHPESWDLRLPLSAGSGSVPSRHGLEGVVYVGRRTGWVLISRLTGPVLTQAHQISDWQPITSCPVLVLSQRRRDLEFRLFLCTFPWTLQDWRCRRVPGRRLVPFSPRLDFLCSFRGQQPQRRSVSLLASCCTPQSSRPQFQQGILRNGFLPHSFVAVSWSGERQIARSAAGAIAIPSQIQSSPSPSPFPRTSSKSAGIIR